MKELEHLYKGRKVRTAEKDGEILFRLSDVSDVLGLTNAYRQVRGRKGVHSMQTPTSGGAQDIIYISEPNLYRLVFRSRREEAERFQDFVFEEVLPRIRKTGKYSIDGHLAEMSRKNRNSLTDKWKESGVSKPHEYAKLTIEEYNSLRFPKGLRKKDMSKEHILLLSAFEAMESLNLHYNPADGFFECKQSIRNTADKVIESTGEEKEKITNRPRT